MQGPLCIRFSPGHSIKLSGVNHCGKGLTERARKQESSREDPGEGRGKGLQGDPGEGRGKWMEKGFILREEE